MDADMNVLILNFHVDCTTKYASAFILQHVGIASVILKISLLMMKRFFHFLVLR